MSEAATPRLSASLILIQPLDSKTSDGYDYQTLLVQRHATKGSFLSAHVFPGGNIDKADYASSWKEVAPEEDDESRALKVCAIRETFEECGLLAATASRQSLSTEERLQWRRKVHGEADAFARLVRLPAAGGLPSLGSLVHRGRFITPATLSKASPALREVTKTDEAQRWDTHFFISILPPSPAPSDEPSTSSPVSSPVASSDGVETVSVEWLTPLAAVDRGLLPRSDPGRIIFAPPQLYFLAELVPSRTWRSLIDGSTGLVRTRTIVPFTPEITVVDTFASGDDGDGSSFATVLPGDPNHSESAAMARPPRPDAVHRTYIDPPSGSKAGSLTIKGVRRYGMEEVLGPGWHDMAEGETFSASDRARASKL